MHMAYLFAFIVALHLCAAAAQVERDAEYCEAEDSCQRVLPESTLLHNEENHLSESLELAVHIANDINQTINVSDLLEMKIELATQKVRVGFVGMMKVGKSTTLNALLHKRYLPSAIQAETAIEVSISHDKNVPDGVLVGEHFTHSSEELARGASSIHSKLWNINKQKRSKQNLYKKVLLNISIPFLSMLSKKISLTISDTPGSDEAVVEGLDLDNNIQHLAAFVVVLDYRKMKSDAEIALLRSLKQKHQTILNSPERLLFILNHMNAFDEHRAVKMEDSIRPNEAPRFVADYLKDLLQLNISPDQVIPYSAYWALESRICLDDPHHVDDSIMEEAQLIFRNQGQSDTTDGGGNNMAICKTLEKYSNILMIEKRLIHLFVDYGHKVIERDIADKAMLIFTNLLSTINSTLVELGVPARNETLLHQKQVIVSVDQIIKDVPNRLTELFMLRTSTLANMSSTWIATTANMTDMVLKDLDAVIFRTYDHVSNAVQKAKNDLIEKLIPKIEQSCNDIVHHHHDIGMLQLQEQWMGLQQELSLIFGNKSLLYPLPKMAELRIPSLSLQETLHCKIHSFQDIDIADIVREDQGCLIQKATGVYCMIFTCEDIATPASLYTVKTLTLKNSMTKSLNGCSKTIETLLTDNLDSFSSSANRKLKNSIESWWKDEKPKEETKLRSLESNLQKAIREKTLLDEKRSKLEDALQNVKRILNNA